MSQKLVIGWLYPELMSTYGDRGNIIVLQKRCQWRGINTEIKHLDLGFRIYDLQKCNLLFMGGAQDRQQKIVAADLRSKAKVLKEMIENGIPGLFICGAYQFLGNYYKEADGTIIKGLGILNLYTEHPGQNAKRLIGNVVISVDVILSDSEGSRDSSSPSAPQNDIGKNTLIGFENHGGRTHLGKGIQPLGKVIVGYGNNGQDKTEGAIYKNTFGTYLHGPVLPKNPHLADLLIRLSLEKKYGGNIKLMPLDDSLEWQAHKTIVKRLV